MTRNNFFYMIPLKDLVIFPKSVMPLFIGRKKSIKAIEKCTR